MCPGDFRCQTHIMEKEPEELNYQAVNHSSNFALLEYSLEQQQNQQQPLKPRENSEDNIEMVDFMYNGHPPPPPTALSLDKLSFADVMQFADFGPKLALTHSKIPDEENYFLRFPVLSEKLQEDPLMFPPHLPPPRLPPPAVNGEDGFNRMMQLDEEGEEADREEGDEHEPRCSENASSVQQIPFLGGVQPMAGSGEVKNKRKRPRTLKTNEEVESQRMTHIAVERNRRKQMNEHLRVLRSLMPGSYVQRGDQASIIGGAIEFVRELEQLLQCLESQKRRRIYGTTEAPRSNITDHVPPPAIQQTIAQPPPFFPQSPLPPNTTDHMKQLLEFETCGGLREETAENKSSLADIEVKLLGFDAMIKILSRRQPGQLLRTIAALEELQLNILHTNITTIEQTVLYSFNVKIMGETRFTAEDIANSVQQIFHFISASTM